MVQWCSSPLLEHNRTINLPKFKYDLISCRFYSSCVHTCTHTIYAHTPEHCPERWMLCPLYEMEINAESMAGVLQLNRLSINRSARCSFLHFTAVYVRSISPCWIAEDKTKNQGPTLSTLPCDLQALWHSHHGLAFFTVIQGFGIQLASIKSLGGRHVHWWKISFKISESCSTVVLRQV